MDHYTHDPTKKNDIPSDLAVGFVVFRDHVAKIISRCASPKEEHLLLVSIGSSRRSLSLKVSGWTSDVTSQDSA